MADTTFVNGTVIQPAWLNDVNDTVYGLPDSTSTSLGDTLIAVKKTATDAVATTQHVVNERAELSVFDFMTTAQVADVVANTLTLDVTTAVSAAKTAAALAGFSLFFPAGSYKLTSGLTFTDFPVIRGIKGKSILTFYSPSAAACFVVNTANYALGVPHVCFVDGITLDGTNTTAKIGFHLGTNALSGRISLRDVEAVNFTGVGGCGLVVKDCVEVSVSDSLFSLSYNNIVILGSSGFPTTVTIRESNIREAVKKGVYIQSGLSIRLLDNIIESNYEEGLYVVPTASDNLLGIESVGNHYENNWNGGASQYQINVVGDTLAKCRSFVSRDDKFDHGTASISPISITKSRDFIVDSPVLLQVPTALLNVATTATGQIIGWPHGTLALSETTLAVAAGCTVLGVGDRAGSTKTIATGVITIGPFGIYAVDTEGAAGSDDLDTINGGTFDGQLLRLRAANDARTVVCKDATGNLQLNGDFSLTHSHDRIVLEWNGTNWCEISRSDNTA